MLLTEPLRLGDGVADQEKDARADAERDTVCDTLAVAERERDGLAVPVMLAEGERDCDVVTVPEGLRLSIGDAELVKLALADADPETLIERDCELETVAVGLGEAGVLVAVILPDVVAVGERLIEGDAVEESDRELVVVTDDETVGDRLMDCVGDTDDVRVAVGVAVAADRVAVIVPVIVAVGLTDIVTECDVDAEAEAEAEAEADPDDDGEVDGE